MLKLYETKERSRKAYHKKGYVKQRLCFERENKKEFGIVFRTVFYQRVIIMKNPFDYLYIAFIDTRANVKDNFDIVLHFFYDFVANSTFEG